MLIRINFLCFVFLLFCNSAFTKVEVYFSPSKACENAIISNINSSKYEIKIAIYDFTNKRIAKAVERAKERGILVRILTDKGQGKKKDSQIRKLAVKGVLVKYSSGEGLQHNKFAVFDNKKVLTGSANWTYSAFSKNSENCIFLDDIEVVSKFSYRFDELWLPH